MDQNTKMFDSFKGQKTNKQILNEVYESLKEKDLQRREYLEK